MATQVENEQLCLIEIGRMIEKEYPTMLFTSLEDMRLYVNADLGINIRHAMPIPDAMHELKTGIRRACYDRARGVV